MEGFYISIIFLGILLIAGSLFFILMDRVNGKDFFQEFDRKKDEMFNLIQESEEMIQELNRMSDYVVTAISEKNQEFFNKAMSSEKPEPAPDRNPEKVPTPELLPKPIQEAAANTKAAPDQDVEHEAEKAVNTQIPNNILEKTKDNPEDSTKTKLILNDKRREVLKMIEQGLNNDEIAEKMKMGKGEIGLIRGLSK